MKASRIKESKPAYRAKRKAAPKPRPARVPLQWAQVEQATQPIVLERDGQPIAVVVPYTQYRRLTETRLQAWRELDELLARVHARTEPFAPEEIEADITLARKEVRERRNGPRHRR